MTELPAEDRDAASPTLPDVSAPPPVLSSAERRTLRARAHDLDPVVMIGDAGLTDAVLAEADRALGRHGLIKVRVFGDDREARLGIAAMLSERLGCALVQSIGKLLVLWRPGAEAVDGKGAKPPARRREAAVPKKLAALGKTAPKRRARPGPPRPDADAPAPKRRLASKQLRAGPGIRSAKGALDPTVTPRTRGAAPAGTSTERTPRPTTKRSSARSPAAPSRGQPARKPGVPSAARPPASGSRQGARSATPSTDTERPAPRTRAIRRGR
jgi:RNA-binding protein